MNARSLLASLLLSFALINPALADYKPASMAPNASNAVLPDARINIGMGASFANLLTGMVPVVNTGNLTSVDIPSGVAADSTAAVFINLTNTCTVDLATSGAGGIDTGAIAASTWYAYYVMQGTSGTSCIGTAATSSTVGTPSLPAGYSFSRYVGRAKTDGSSHILSSYILPAGKYWIDTINGAVVWVKPASVAGVLLQGCGAGGGGGSGAIQISGTASSGGGSGGGPRCLPNEGIYIPAATIGNNLTFNMPAQAAGGNAITASIATQGNDGSDATSLTVVNSASVTVMTIGGGGKGQGGRAANTSSTGGGSGGVGGSAVGNGAGANGGTAGGVGAGPTPPSNLGIAAAGSGSAAGGAGTVGGTALNGGGGGSGSGGGTDSTCATASWVGANSGRVLFDLGQVAGGQNAGSPDGGTSATNQASIFFPGPGSGGGRGGQNAGGRGGNGGDGALGNGGAGGGSVCAASGSQTSGAGGKGGPAAILLTEM